MLSFIIAVTLCVTVWLLLQSGIRRTIGAVLGLVNASLWMLASYSAGAYPVTLVAGICALQFACFLLSLSTVAFRRSHAN
jgi:hypothetical protein